MSSPLVSAVRLASPGLYEALSAYCCSPYRPSRCPVIIRCQGISCLSENTASTWREKRHGKYEMQFFNKSFRAAIGCCPYFCKELTPRLSPDLIISNFDGMPQAHSVCQLVPVPPHAHTACVLALLPLLFLQQHRLPLFAVAMHLYPAAGGLLQE